MNSSFTEQHRAFRRTVSRWVQKELAPHALEWDEAEIFPREVFIQAGKLGLLGLRHDPSFGGMGLDYWYTVAFVEELTRSNNAGLAMALIVQAEIATPIINEVGSDEQKELFMKPAISGEKIAALAISEPDCGSDVASIRTTAKVDGDDLIISGTKTWITNGTRADFVTLAVRTGPEGYKGISLVTFPTDVKGYSVGQKLKKVGNFASDTAILYFDNCRIPRRYVLGEEGKGFKYIMTNFQGERLVAALLATETMENVIHSTIQYGKERQAFGTPLLNFQALRHRLIENIAKAKASKCLAYHATKLFDDFLQKRSAFLPTEEISMAKLHCCDVAQQVAYDCQQFFGGMGYVTENPVARAWRDLRLLTIGGGTSEIMKEILSKNLLQ